MKSSRHLFLASALILASLLNQSATAARGGNGGGGGGGGGNDPCSGDTTVSQAPQAIAQTSGSKLRITLTGASSDPSGIASTVFLGLREEEVIVKDLNRNLVIARKNTRDSVNILPGLNGAFHLGEIIEVDGVAGAESLEVSINTYDGCRNFRRTVIASSISIPDAASESTPPVILQFSVQAQGSGTYARYKFNTIARDASLSTFEYSCNGQPLPLGQYVHPIGWVYGDNLKSLYSEADTQPSNMNLAYAINASLSYAGVSDQSFYDSTSWFHGSLCVVTVTDLSGNQSSATLIVP